MQPARKERYDYRKGNYQPTDSPNSNASTVMPPQQPRPDTRDPETGASLPPKEDRKSCCSCGCCCRFICYVLIFLFIILAALVVVIMFYFPKPPKFKMVSVDLKKSAVYDVTSENSYDIEINRLWGDIQYNKKKLVDYSTDRVNIVKLDTTRVELNLEDLNLDPDLIKHCMKSKDFPADLNVNIEFKLFKFKVKRTEPITIPCPPLPKNLPTGLPKDLPAGVNDKDVTKLLQDKQIPK